MSTMFARTGRVGGWCRTREFWFLLAALVLPLGWMLPVCRFAWVRVVSQRGARAGRLLS